ncbi:hypothetical protein [Actinomycetospora chiangmaiensis]|uniref:hypothetical protein n=1 Tax=Actinomycetospora chiangmaiensis TaxID=402650 RepID=UPI0003AB40B3|nr:hypothetical protein [Actinomycetospora chiangmaiensis]
MSVPARGIARNLVIAGSVTAGLLGGGAAALAAPAAPAAPAGQVIPAACGDTVTASPGDQVRITSRTGKPYTVNVTQSSPSTQVWSAGPLCQVRVDAVQRPVAAPMYVAPPVAPIAPVAPAGTAPAGAFAPAPVAPVAPVATVPRATAPAPSLLGPAVAGAPLATAPGLPFGAMPPVASAPLPPIAQDPTAAVSRTAEGRPDTGDGPSDVPLVLGAIAVGAVAAGAIRYRMLHKQMTAEQPAGPAPEPAGRHAAPADEVAPVPPVEEEATQFAPAPMAYEPTAFDPTVAQRTPFEDAAFGAAPFAAAFDRAPHDDDLMETAYVERVAAVRPYFAADVDPYGYDDDPSADTTVVERIPAARV